MKRVKTMSIVLGLVVSVLTCVWLVMQISGCEHRKDSSTARPATTKLCYVLYDGAPLPSGSVVTNTVNRQAEMDDFSRFRPRPEWQINSEIHIWGPVDSQGKRMRLGTATLDARHGEWIRIELWSN